MFHLFGLSEQTAVKTLKRKTVFKNNIESYFHSFHLYLWCVFQTLFSLISGKTVFKELSRATHVK